MEGLKKVLRQIFKAFKRHWLVVLIVALALFLRLFRISAYMTFLGDEGRDALVWLRMWREGKFVLIGPQTSIGNMYLGPLFYYLLFPFYVLLGTAGPSIGTALMGGATVFLLWYFGRIWFSPRVGLTAAFLSAISPAAIVLSRSSWNPNIMPFFALLVVWGIWQFWEKKNYLWLALEGVLLSFAVQSHYLGLLLMALVLLFDLIKSKDKELKKFLVYSALFFLSFGLLTILPLVWFDLRHNFINFQAFYKFFSERQATVNLKPYKAIPELWPLWQMLVTRLVAGKSVIAGFWSAIGVLVLLFWSAVAFPIQSGLATKKKAYFLILTWIFIGVLGMGLYKQHIYDHYFGFLFPAVFLLVALALERLWPMNKIGRFLALAGLLGLSLFSLWESPLRYPPSGQAERTAAVCQKIIEESRGKPFNLGMIAKQNYDAGYRYFLEKQGFRPVAIDAQRSKETITDQLFVVCEESVCEPTTHPQAEIANFGWSRIEEEWTFPWGIKLFKLGHNR
jgi:4-amino-4-deoxy-L-arabinose transferase-like glycosyltransferase